MTEHLKLFESELRKANYLSYAPRFVMEHEKDLRKALDQAFNRGMEVGFGSFREFQKAVMDAATIGSLALFWRAFESYCRSMYRTSNCLATIRLRCPGFVAQCHRNHPSEHVLTILRDVRDRELHALGGYNVIQCNRPPDDITLQPVIVSEYEDEKLVLLCHDLTSDQRSQWQESIPVSRIRNDLISLGDFLIEMSDECIREFDALSTQTGSHRKGKKLTPRKRIVFPQLSASGSEG